jgi:glycosyltransferase involved in cell wall biosynthesis
LKAYILFKITDNPRGGGNQFIRNLNNYFNEKNIATTKIHDADVILFNSHQHIFSLIFAKLKYPNIIFIHRVDGPMSLYNSRFDHRDKIVFCLNDIFSDATIFQSSWSMCQNNKLHEFKNYLNTVITNAPDPDLFNTIHSIPYKTKDKIKIIANSWSTNLNKGFHIYKWLDQNLDFNKYEMTFVGNSPFKFINIINIGPLNSSELSIELKKNDIYITASKNDPCSNSLIEAMHCGLVVLAFNGGGHNQIVGDAGKFFNTKEEIPFILDELVNNYSFYKSKISLPLMSEVGRKYYQFLNKVYQDSCQNIFERKSLNFLVIFKIFLKLLYWKLLYKFFK